MAATHAIPKYATQRYMAWQHRRQTPLAGCEVKMNKRREGVEEEARKERRI